MQFTIKDFQEPSMMKHVHTTLHHLFQSAYRKTEDFIEIASCEQQSGNFWKRVFSIVAYFKEEELGRDKIEPSDVTDYFSYDLIKHVCAASNLSTGDAQHYFEKQYPYLELLQAIRINASQWYSQNLDPAKVVVIFETMEKLPKPFGDERFRCVPIHTHTYKRGYDYSAWLNQEKGIFKPCGKQRYSSSFRQIYLDGKFGILIFFKNKPTITISFNIDNNDNIYLHQIQSHVKARGLYRLGENWQQKTLDYVCTLFPNHKLNIIDGEFLSNMVKNSYSKDCAENDLPSKSELLKIQRTYDQLRPEFQKEFIIGDVKYRRL